MSDEGCKHEIISSQAVNFLENNTVFLLPLEYISCIRCNYRGILDSFNGKVADASADSTKKLLEEYKEKARELKKAHDSKIIKPSASDLKLIS